MIQTNNKTNNSHKPLVGFFPCFYSMGETIPLIKIAESFMSMGGKAIFFSHGGDYEYLAEEIGCKVIKLNDILENLPFNGRDLFIQGKHFGLKVMQMYSPRRIQKSVEEEITAFTRENIKLLVCSFNLTSSISAQVVNIPLITVVSGVSTPLYYKSNLATYPDNIEFFLTRLIPYNVKNRIFKFVILHNNFLGIRFNRIGKKYNIPRFKHSSDVYMSGELFVCDDIYFLGVKPTKNYPAKNFIGPIFGGKFSNLNLDSEIESHLKRKGKSIVVVMGSTGVKSIFLKIIDVLSKTDYNVIAVYTNLLDENNLPKVSDNIILKKFVPLDSVLKHVDLAITHGGRGTIYQIADSGIPAICIPFFQDHQGNIDNLVRKGCAIQLSMKFFKKDMLVKSIDKIFGSYKNYLINAQKLSKLLQKKRGEEVAAKRIFEILEENKNN